jgi:hypothetical protein
VNQALWLLIGLQLRGWLRYLWRSLGTVKGAFLAILGSGVLLLLLLPLLFPSRDPQAPPVDVADKIRTYGPAGLIAYCLANVLLFSSERGVYFTPAEVSFLFPGPFGRRGLLLYKVLSMLLIGLPTAAVMVLFIGVYASWLLAAFIGVVLVFVFIELFSMAINLLGAALGARLFSRARKALAVVVGVAALAVVRIIMAPYAHEVRDRFSVLVASPTWQVASTPLRCFFDAFLARTWGELAGPTAVGLLVNVLLLGVVLRLDANYLEASAATSARVYARLQRLKRGGLAGDGAGGGALLRFSLPAFPYWGGIGPTLWRQSTTALRGLGRLLVVLAIVSVLMLVPLTSGDSGADPGLKLATILLWLTIFLTTLVPFDFRGDIDRIALLKTLPLPAWRLAVGQLLTPTLLLSAIQWAFLALMVPLVPDSGEWTISPLMLAVFVLPLNFLQFALDNLLFLLFPSRLVASSPGDFQALGRNVLFMLAKVAILILVSLPAVLVSVVTFAVLIRTHDQERAIATATAVAGPVFAVSILLSGPALVPLVALAFRGFDVSRDTPA